jgi:hypothetical protein
VTAEALEVVERLLEAFDRVDLHRPSLALGVFELISGDEEDRCPGSAHRVRLTGRPVPEERQILLSATVPLGEAADR